MNNYKYFILFFCLTNCYSVITNPQNELNAEKCKKMIDEIKNKAYFLPIQDKLLYEVLKKFQTEELPAYKKISYVSNYQTYITSQINGIIKICFLEENKINIHKIGLQTEFYGCPFQYISTIDTNLIIVASKKNKFTIENNLNQTILDNIISSLLKNDIKTKTDSLGKKKQVSNAIFLHPSYWEVVFEKSTYKIIKKEFDEDFDKNCHCRKLFF